MFDKVYFNGVFHTMEGQNETCNAVAIKNGLIAATYLSLSGSLKEVKKAVKARKYVDLQGRHVTPGLVDCHLHFLSFAVMQVFGCEIHELVGDKLLPNTMETVLTKMDDYCKTANTPFVLFFNYCVSAVDTNSLPTRQQLDKISHGKQVVVYTNDGHSSAMNSDTLKILNINNDVGIFEGESHETIQGHVTDLMLKYVNIITLSRGIAKATNTAAMYGITTLCTLEGFDELPRDSSFDLMLSIVSRLQLRFRVYPEYRDVDKAQKYFNRFVSARLGGCGAWEFDGAVGSHSAAFPQEYKDRKGCFGRLYDSTANWRERSIKASKAGCQLAAHAIGTSAITQALDVYESLDKVDGVTNRIEHFEFPCSADVDRAIAMKLNIVPQPGYSWFDKRYFNSYYSFLPKEIADQQIPLKRLVDGGVNICGGSDAPVQDIDPFLQMQGMVEFWNDEQSLTPFQAFSAYTINGGKMLNENIGSIKVGNVADLCVFESCPFSKKMLGVKPICVIVGGRKYKPMKQNVLGLLLTLCKKAKKV